MFSWCEFHGFRLNKKKSKMTIGGLYEKYYKAIIDSWSLIYSTREEYDETIRNLPRLINGQTLFGTTNMQIFVEQFFLSLSMVISPLILQYSGQQSKKESDIKSDAARGMMHNMMDRIEKEAYKITNVNPSLSSKPTSTENKSTNEKTKLLNEIQQNQKESYDFFAEYDTHIEEIDFSVRAYNILRRAGVKKISDICEADFTPVINMLSSKSINEIFIKTYQKIYSTKKDAHNTSDHLSQAVENTNK